jgi:uncharacterized RDD family membrane protein YckC
MSQQPASFSYASPSASNERQGFGLRFAAAFIDGLISAVPVVVLTMVGGKHFGPFLAAAAVLAYSTLEFLKAATPGKMIFKLKITNEDGTEATRNALFKRWMIKQVPNAFWLATGLFLLLRIDTIAGLFNWVTIFTGIGYVISCCLTFRPQRQALHDTMAHTSVYRTQAAAAAIPTPAQEPQRQAA